jgi:segregation and condensation protein B
MSLTPIELKSALEAIIYAADEPATVDQMAAALGEEKHVVRTALDELVGSYGSDERGIEIRAVGGGYRVYTKPQHHDVVRRFIKSLRPPLRLTMPALETLAVIAYKQPATQPEIQEIRGVNCAGVIQTLLEKRLITTAGRKHVIGRPILYRTSKDFLMRFGLSDVDELPSLKEFEALAREALGTEDGVAGPAPDDAPTESAAGSVGDFSEAENSGVSTADAGGYDDISSDAGHSSDGDVSTDAGVSGNADVSSDKDAPSETSGAVAAGEAQSQNSPAAGPDAAHEENGNAFGGAASAADDASQQPPNHPARGDAD